ncbi:MAG TPA: PaaI family thioesterase [Syntrophorhabdaceae bacterium]|jgi:uncharacterized protein (TIGR00369 family)
MAEMLPKYEKCFFCGPATGGLGLELHYADERAFCEFLAPDRFQGYEGMLHGGIVTGILDEVMWWTLFVRTKVVSATWKIEVEFLRPVACGNRYKAWAELRGGSSRRYDLYSEIADMEDRVCARGTGTFFRTKGFVLEDVIKVLDFRGVSPSMRSLFK